MNTLRKATLVLSIAATAILSQAAFAKPQPVSALDFGGKSSPFISPDDATFGRR